MSIWNDLNTPDDFKNDWYGELTNQCGHTLLGIVAVMVFCFAWREATGEMPFRPLAALACVAPYIAIEWRVQGWRSGDSWFDSAMFIMGVTTPLVTFAEISASGDTTTVALDHRAGLVCVAVWLLFLGPRVLRRYARNGGGKAVQKQAERAIIPDDFDGAFSDAGMVERVICCASGIGARGNGVDRVGINRPSSQGAAQ